MSTSSTATATLPHNTHYGYSHHQNYSTTQLSNRGNKPPASHGSGRFAGTNLTSAPQLASSHHHAGIPSLPEIEGKSHSYSLTGSGPREEMGSMDDNVRKRQRNGGPDWQSFYKNGLPKEVIVINDSPEPTGPLASTTNGAQKAMNRKEVSTLNHTNKKRKRDLVAPVYDPVYHLEQTPSIDDDGSSHDSSISSTNTSGRTSSVVNNTTTATSLGSQYSQNGANGAESPMNPGLKRKRAATRLQLVSEAKRREPELLDAYTSYLAPPRPPMKSGDVTVKTQPDNSSTKHCKVDDDDGHYIVVPDSNLTDRYQIVRLLGQGTFGKVVQARDKRRGGSAVAIKIIRSVQKYRDASRIELRVLATLKLNDAENRNKCIHLRDCFDYRGHICIVMDLLGQSVFDFLKANSFVPFPNSHIQSFARQLFTSVAFLHDINLIHTDLKPENILLCDSLYQTFTYNRKAPSSSTNVNKSVQQRKVLFDTEIRLIDFGSATFQDECHSSVVSTRHYRAPEIILGLGWSYPCDIWSLGCILVEFFTGDALFQTHDNLEHLAMMEAVGDVRIDPHLVQQVNKMASRNSSTSASKYFKRLKLDYPAQDTSRASKRFVKCMKRLIDIIPQSTSFYRNFLDLLQRIFVYDPANRITAKAALQHPWFREIAGPDDGTEALKIRRAREADAAAPEGGQGEAQRRHQRIVCCGRNSRVVISHGR